MWCKINKSSYYDPYLLNIDTGARIYIFHGEQDEFNWTTYQLRYDYPYSRYEDTLVLKTKMFNLTQIQEEHKYSSPLSDDIDEIYENIQNGKNFEILAQF